MATAVWHFQSLPKCDAIGKFSATVDERRRVVRNRFSAEERMSKIRKLEINFAFGVIGHMEICQCVERDKQARKTIVSEMSNLRL